ncbi:MBL fold metallo-hydrolase [Macrococcus armenti]|uniref:MBL fold metallo-hydrolase n=1 Tax=Macrococcus armenti TaxID=2875764 RepID=UPI001CCF7DDB|nr:MBL fold metallo-hydrolase [Macrococcus armenti]UBH13444.1 MBL fold metallo-hydrolase [Macrococcus armenti]
MSNTQIAFYSGTNTIGGTIFSVTYGKDRFIADFGHSPKSALYDERIHTRGNISDEVVVGILPDIPDFYKDSQWNTVVGISHMHLDHMGLLQYIPHNVDIITSRDSKNLYEQLTAIGDGQPSFDANRLTAVEPNKCFKVGQIEITFIPVNHDVIGACAIRIATPDTVIMYSGDIRLNDDDALTDAWIHEAGDVDYLIIETTSLSFDNTEKEAYVPHTFGECNQYILNIYQRNIKRIIDYVKLTELMQYTFVVDDRIATLIDAFYDGDTSHCYMYESVKPIGYTGSIQTITLEEAIQLEKVVIQHDFSNWLLLSHFNLSGFDYLHSNGMPLGDFDPGYKVMKAWIERLNLNYVDFQKSGHATIAQLEEVVNTIKPKVLIPQHGFYPERLQYPNRILPEIGKVYEL